MSNQQLFAVQYLMFTILDAVDAGGDMGAPSGILYAGLAGVINLSQYQQMTQGMVQHGLLVQDGDLFTLSEAGRERLAKLKQAFPSVAAA